MYVCTNAKRGYVAKRRASYGVWQPVLIRNSTDGGSRLSAVHTPYSLVGQSS